MKRESTSELQSYAQRHVVTILIALVVLELIWFTAYLLIPLANAPAPKPGHSGWTKGQFLIGSVPEIFIRGLKFRASYLGMALYELSHVGNLPQRLPIVLAAGFIAASAIATGSLILRVLRLRQWFDRSERLAIAYGLGTTMLGLAAMISGRMGWIGPWPVRVGLAVPIVLEILWWILSAIRSGKDNSSPTVSKAEPTRIGPLIGMAMIVGPFLLTMALGAMLPTIEFDAIEYHVQGPKEYFQAGRIAFLPHNVYTSMPFSVEMLHLLGMEVVNDWWLGALVGQLLIAGFAPAAALLIARTAGRLGSPRAGWVAAVVYLTTPWVYRVAVLPYVEGPLCYFHAALLWAITKTQGSGLSTGDSGRDVEALSPQSSVLSPLMGLLAGGAMATKYPGLISAVIPFSIWALWASWRDRNWRIAAGFAVGVAVVMTPWLAKNVVDTGNPVYPLGYKVFGGSHWSPALDAKWSAAHGPKPVEVGAFFRSIGDVAGISDWQSPLFTALVPLAFLRRGSRTAVFRLSLYTGYLFLTWWLFTHRLDRFWLPMLPGLAILAGLGADWTRSRAWTALLAAMMGLGIWVNAMFCSTALAAGYNQWTDDLPFLRTDVPQFMNAPLARLDAELPPGAKPLLVGQAAVFHVNRPIVYNTVFNEETIETLAKGRTPEELGDELRKRGVTHVYVDWSEINRYRSPGNYGFTPFVTTEFFQGLVKAEVLDKPVRFGPRHELYKVRDAPKH